MLVLKIYALQKQPAYHVNLHFVRLLLSMSLLQQKSQAVSRKFFLLKHANDIRIWHHQGTGTNLKFALTSANVISSEMRFSAKQFC